MRSVGAPHPDYTRDKTSTPLTTGLSHSLTVHCLGSILGSVPTEVFGNSSGNTREPKSHVLNTKLRLLLLKSSPELEAYQTLPSFVSPGVYGESSVIWYCRRSSGFSLPGDGTSYLSPPREPLGEGRDLTVLGPVLVILRPRSESPNPKGYFRICYRSSPFGPLADCG